jgi:hypothetical protein
MSVLSSLWFYMLCSCATAVYLLEASSDIPLVMICAMVKDEDPYVDEWIKYHLKLGFDLIQLYDNRRNTSTKLASLPQSYSQRVKVLHYVGDGVQNRAYTNCHDQYIDQQAWVAFIDIDEFIVLRKHSTITELLLATVIPNKDGALSLSRIPFGSNGHKHYSSEPVLSRFTARRQEPDIFVKTIAFLPAIRRIELHFVRLLSGKHGVDCHGNPIKAAVHNTPSEDIAAINHYFTKSAEEFKLKKLRGMGHTKNKRQRYSGEVGLRLIAKEFAMYNNESNSVQDTRAWDWYRTNVLLQPPT